MPIPPRQRDRILPVVAIGSKEFEHLCADLLETAFSDVKRTALKRRSGLPQYGVDVEGFDGRNRPIVVVSCKCYHDIEAWEVRAWIDDFRKHLDTHWAGKGVRHFVLAISVETNDDDINDAAMQLSDELEERGITFELWGSFELTNFLRKDPPLIQRYFNMAWVHAIAGEIPYGAPTATTSAPIFSQNPAVPGGVFAQIEAQYLPALNDLHSQTLEHAMADLRSGNQGSLLKWLEGAQGNGVVWAGIATATKARALRAAAMIELSHGNLAGSASLLDQAEAIHRPPDRSARALLLRASSGISAACDYLVGPADRKERETLAAFLIEDGRPKDALDVMEPLLGEDVSSEVLRLRAIARFILGRRSKEAISLATSAVARDTKSPMAIVSLGQIRISAALAHGAEPQFGLVPNPVSSALVRATPEARSLLIAAAEDFERVRSRTEGYLRRDVEVWKLAALLLNRDTLAEAKSFARVLLSRPEVEPAVVAWCLQYGLPIRKGRVRKHLRDALENGKGTPGHAAVLALMFSASDGPQKGLAIIDRYASRFPNSAEAFFAHWRSQFSDTDSGEDGTYAKAIRTVFRDGNIAPLVSFLMSGAATIENLIAGGEALASRDAYAELYQLRERLVETGTARGLELAATSAYNLSEVREGFRLLEPVREGQMDETPFLFRLRVGIDEELANHGQLISELERKLATKDDPFLRQRLLGAYMRIGDLDNLRKQTELAIDSGSVEGENAVRLAYALRQHAPDTARRALGAVTSEDIPDALAPTALAITGELGLRELHEKMLGRLLQSPDANNAIVKFDTVEDVVAFVQKNSEERRKRVDDWLHGRIPAAVAMADDAKAYVLLFLSNIGLTSFPEADTIPLMLRSGVARRSMPDGETPRSLRVDLSGMLLADRMGILDRLEQAFEIKIPEALPEALMEVISDLPEDVNAIVSVIRSMQGSDSPVEVVVDPADAGDEISTLSEGISEDQKQGFAHAVDTAFRGGHLTKTQVDQMFGRFEVPEFSPRKERPSLLIAGNAALELAQPDMLQPLARGFPVRIRQAELERLLKLADHWEDASRVRSRLVELARLVTDRLSTGRWRTIVSSGQANGGGATRPPAHLRCLMQTLPTGSDVEHELFWIEDRTISKATVPNAVDLGMILDHLAANGHLDPGAMTALALDLRRIGYSFLAIDKNEILATVMRAPVVDGELVENEELADLRRWFARDVLRLKYLDQTTVIDGEGRIVGENRRTIDLGHVAEHVIERVWSTSGLPTEEKAARSNWIWSMLRLDFVPSPTAMDDDAARRQLACIAAMQVLTIPVQADFSNRPFPDDVRAPFIAWVMNSIVRPLDAADAEAGRVLAEVTASLIVHAFEAARDGDPQIERLLRERVRKIVSPFLDLLPHVWDTRIIENDDLRELLGRQVILMVDLDSKHQLGVREVSDAIGEWLRTGADAVRVRLRPDGDEADLSVSENEGALDVVIEQGGQRWALHRSTVALLHPDLETRKRLLSALPKGMNIGDPITAEFLTEVAETPSVEARVDIYHRKANFDFAASRVAMWERIHVGSAIQISDLALPEPASILNFLGLPGEFRGDGRDLLASALPVLKDALGTSEAVSRLSGLPIRLPDDVLRECAAKGLADSAGGDFESFPLALSRLLGRVLSGDTVADTAFKPDRVQLFIAVLRHSARQAQYDAEWSALPPELAFCLVWVHANEMTRNLSVEGLNLSDVAHWLTDRTPVGILDRDRQEKWPRWAVACTMGMTVTGLMGAAAGELLARGAVLSEPIKELLGHVGERGWMPHPDLFLPRPTGPDGYWPANDAIEMLSTTGWLPQENPFADKGHNELLQWIFDETDVNDPPLLPAMVAIMIDLERVDDHNVEALRGRLDVLDAGNRVTHTDPSYDAYAEVFARTCARQGDRSAFFDWVGRVVTESKERWPRGSVDLDGKDDAGRAALSIMNACHIFSWACCRRTDDRIGTLCELATSAVDHWPALHRSVLGFLERAAKQIDTPTAARALLLTMLSMRAR